MGDEQLRRAPAAAVSRSMRSGCCPVRGAELGSGGREAGMDCADRSEGVQGCGGKSVVVVQAGRGQWTVGCWTPWLVLEDHLQVFTTTRDCEFGRFACAHRPPAAPRQPYPAASPLSNSIPSCLCAVLALCCSNNGARQRPVLCALLVCFPSTLHRPGSRADMLYSSGHSGRFGHEFLGMHLVRPSGSYVGLMRPRV